MGLLLFILTTAMLTDIIANNINNEGDDSNSDDDGDGNNNDVDHDKQ